MRNSDIKTTNINELFITFHAILSDNDVFVCPLELILREVPPDQAPQNQEGEEELLEEDGIGLFAGYKKRRRVDTTRPEAQLNNYLSLVTNQKCLTFWETNRSSLPALYPIAIRALSVPATSAPVERVFSHGGIIMRPHRSRMKGNTLSNLVFLKCNSLNL